MYHLVASEPEVIDQTSSTPVIVCPDIIIVLTIAATQTEGSGQRYRRMSEGPAERLKDGLVVQVFHVRAHTCVNVVVLVADAR